MKTTLPLIRTLVGRPFLGLGVIVLALGFFALCPLAKAVVPAPDGGYPNGNTAEGDSALFSLTSGTANTAVGAGALYSNTTGLRNTATGFQTLNVNNGSFNTANGYRALHLNSNGDENTAEGDSALYSNTIGNYNTAHGSGALRSNTIGSFNTAIGAGALNENTSGSNNTATGLFALDQNNGTNNTADGVRALSVNTTGTQNTATGAFALFQNNGTNNTANGFQALLNNTTGNSNTATGESALKNNTTASNNTADGFQVLFHNISGAGNAAIGYHALFNNNGSSNIALGKGAGVNLTTGSNNIDIGNGGVAGESDTIRIGSIQTRTFIKGISGVAVAGVAVVVNAAGQLGVTASSERFKDEIKPMDKASEAILSLKPVTFRYKKTLGPERVAQFGLIAEEVAEVNPDLVVRDDKGEIYTVRYDAVNAMLLNEFLKEHRKVQNLEATVARQQKTMEVVTVQLKQQAAKIQKVSDQLEITKASRQVVLNNEK